MNTKNIRKVLLVGTGVLILLTAFGLWHGPDTPAGSNNVLSLHAPPFVGIARAETGPATSVIESEAGISAYFSATMSISLSSVRSTFRTIEVETADYIIGSVPVANYPETEDVHVYVHKDGWVLAYYLAADPAGKIFDWRMYHDGGRTDIRTKLENTLAVVAAAANVPFSTSNATYYDFRYPNATHLMLIVEWVYGSGTDSFQAKLPGSFAYYERSWSLGATYAGWYKVDGVTIKSQGGGGWATSEGTLTATQLLPDQFHTIEVGGGPSSYPNNYVYGGLALVYRIP